jgi:hypothetical protein
MSCHKPKPPAFPAKREMELIRAYATGSRITAAAKNYQGHDSHNWRRGEL